MDHRERIRNLSQPGKTGTPDGDKSLSEGGPFP
jgi:hypothetical protein